MNKTHVLISHLKPFKGLWLSLMALAMVCVSTPAFASFTARVVAQDFESGLISVQVGSFSGERSARDEAQKHCNGALRLVGTGSNPAMATVYGSNAYIINKQVFTFKCIQIKENE